MQRELFEDDEIKAFHQRWDLDVDRERINRTRFAQRALKPDEVRRELEATDAVLGDPAAVREFVLAAGQRLGLAILQDKRSDVYRVPIGAGATAGLPDAVRFALPALKTNHWLVSFKSPAPEGAEYLGRNHRFVAALARYLMEEALTKGSAAAACRCGVIRTRAIKRLTTILLLRVRYLLQQPDKAPLLSEEVIVRGLVRGRKADEREWLANGDAQHLLAAAQPDANLPLAEKQQMIAAALAEWPALEPSLSEQIILRAAELEKSHKRVRQAVALKVRQLTLVPQFPPDLLGILILQPVV